MRVSSGRMDPQELIAVSGHIVEAGTALATAIPFTSIVKRMLGPAADEIAERVRDEIKLYRYGRQLSMLSKAEKLARDAGFTPKAVPIKLLFSLLEGASLEENVESSIRARERTLRDLGRYNDLYRLYCTLGFTKAGDEALLTGVSSAYDIEQDEHDRQQFAVIMDELTRFQMWSVMQGKYSERFYLTSYAVQFVRACAAPAARPQADQA